MRSVYAVVPTFNRCSVLENCINALEQQTVRPKIFVCDSASTDGTAAMLQEKFPGVVLCPGTSDLWWTGATNLALSAVLAVAAEDDFILCINDDVMLEPHYVEKLLAAAQKKPRRIVGSVIVDIQNSNVIIDGGTCFNWYTAGRRRPNLGRLITELPTDHEEPVNVLPGRGTLFPVTSFREVGLFAEKALPHYGADYEFTVRCARKGFELVSVYSAIVQSRTDLTGKHNAKNFSWSEFHQMFFSRRSSLMLRDRAVFAWLTRKNPLQAAVFLLFSVCRLLGHYVRTVMRA